MKIHHVGIVVSSIEKAESFMRKFDLEKDYMEFVPEYNANCLFTKDKGDIPIEFVIPTKGVLTNFNNGKGGIHHIAFEVKDVRDTKRKYEKIGMMLLEDEPVNGAGNIIVNFVRPKFSEGILVEFVEKLR